MSGLGSSSNVRFGTFCFWLLSPCGRGGQVRAVWPRSCPRRPQARREADLRGKLFLGLRLFVQGSVRREAGDLARPVEQGDAAVPIFEHANGALGEVMPVPVGRDLQAAALVSDGVVQAGDALLLDAQDVVEFADESNESRAFLRGGHGETGVVLLDVDLRQPAIGRLQG